MLHTNEQSVAHGPEITFVVPCYNSADYMDRCLDTLMPDDDRVEIIIVNDGSTDATAEIADSYKERFPNTVTVIHKENGGHGSAVNAGLANANGMYFKVVDSDDWLDGKSLDRLMNYISKQCDSPEPVDLFVCNYVYDHLYENKQKVMRYNNVFPDGQVVGWQDMGRLLISQYLIMHALFFRTAVLRKANVVLPKHTFYVDNIFANQPLVDVERICYLDEDCYHYFLGREDQSVNESVLCSRIDQQIYVTTYLLDCLDLERAREISPKLENYLIGNISIMLAISDIHLRIIGTPEAYHKQKNMWLRVEMKNRKLYHHLKYRSLGGWTNLPGKAGGFVVLGGYKIAQKIFKFN